MDSRSCLLRADLGPAGFRFPILNELAGRVNQILHAAKRLGQLADQCAVVGQSKGRARLWVRFPNAKHR